MSNSLAANSRVAMSSENSSLMAWIVCLSAGLFFFYEFFQLNLFDVINDSLRSEFKIDAEQISWMSSMYLWADLLFLLPAGAILDRFSARTVILTAMLICVLGTVGFGLTHSFLLASFFHFLSGIGNAFCFLSCVVLVSRWFPSRRQALAIGCIVTMAFIGGMMAHTPFAYLNAQLGWREALLIDAGVGAILLLWIYFIVRDYPPHHIVADSSDENEKPSFYKAVINPQNWLAGLYTSCLNLPILVLCALWGASYLEIVHTLSKMTASNVISLIFVGSIIGCPLAGWISDYRGNRKPLMILGAIASFLTLLPLLWGTVLSELSLSIIFFLLGFFTSTQVITYPFVAESNQSSNTGAATGIASFIIMGGGAVAQVVFGMLIHHHAQSETYNAGDFQFAMWMFPIAILIALGAVLFTRETYCKKLS